MRGGGKGVKTRMVCFVGEVIHDVILGQMSLWKRKFKYVHDPDFLAFLIQFFHTCS